MNRRIQQFLSAENISQSQFADTIGVARASVSHIVAGRNKPGFDFIESMARHYPTLNLEWLVTGKGKMYKDASERPQGALFPAEEPDTELVDSPSEALDQDYQEAPKTEPRISSVTLGTKNQVANSQRSISKIIVLYNDGSYQELK